MSHRFLETLREGVLVADGGMGSMLHQLARPGFPCTDAVNLLEPKIVMEVHSQFLRAGARLIETNSYGANRAKLRRVGLEDDTIAINHKAVKLAREAREVVGVDAFIGGAMGPTGLRIHASGPQAERLKEIYTEQATALEERGVDLFVLETFTNPWELQQALEAIRSVSDLPVLAQLSLPPSDDWSDPTEGELDEEVEDLLAALALVPADVIGLNCSVGPGQLLTAFRRLAVHATDLPLAVQPNSGLPRRVDGRFLYPASDADYYAEFAREAVKMGARIVGGCCGTTPDQVAAMAVALEGFVSPATRATLVELTPPAPPTSAEHREVSGLAGRLAAGEFVVSMQLDPPKGTRTEMVLEAARAFRESGRVHVVDVNSNPMARLHMDALWMSALIENEGMETIAHYTPRDASLMGIEGNLLGAWKYGVRNILAITGDPSLVAGEPGAADVYQTDSIGLVRNIRQLNEGRDCFGHAIGEPPNFTIGVAVNPNADDLAKEVDRFKQKVDEGADFAMTQVFFEWSCWERFVELLGGTCPIPVLAAVWPLTSLRLAVRLHNEVPGIIIPKPVLQRLDRAGKGARREGFALAREMMARAPDYTQGVYVIAPFKRPRNALELFDASEPASLVGG